MGLAVDMVYKCKNTRKCYWLCRDCLRGHSYRCFPKCPDYLSIAKVKKNSEEGGIKVDDQNIIFVLTKEDVLECARRKGIPEEAITDDVFHRVKRGVEFGLECWDEVVNTA